MAIIGLLSTIVYVSFGDARAQSRDKIRMTALKELQLAVEQYRAQTGRYPSKGCSETTIWVGPGPHPAAWGNDNHCAEYIAGLVPDYINALPTDPREEMVDDKGFIYATNADRSAYKILVHRTVEAIQITSFNDEFSRCPSAVGSCAGGVGGNANVYGVYSTGAEDW